MPNHYTTMAICSPGYRFNDDESDLIDFDCNAFNEQMAVEDNLCQIVRPMPKDIDFEEASLDPLWYRWAVENWGTTWGTYGTRAIQLGGDSKPILIKFQSAWGPPKNLDEIAEYLKKTYGFDRVAWVGFDPYDNSTKMLGESQEPTSACLEATK